MPMPICPFLQVAGFLALSTRFFPTLMNILSRLAAEGHDSAAARPPQHLASQSFRNQKQQLELVSSSTQGSSVSSVSSETGLEYSSPQITHRRETHTEEKEVPLY